MKVPTNLNQDKFSDLFFGSEKKYDEYAIDSVSNVGNQLVVDIYSDDNNQIIRNFDFDRFDENNFETIKSKYVSSKKFFGTDIYGRDVFSRVLLGTRVSLSIGLMAVIISTIIGLFLSFGGYYGGKIDSFVVWLINVFWSIPTLLLVIAISLAIEKDFGKFI